MKLWQCKTRQDQIAWIVRRLKAGGTIHQPGIWLGGVDSPMLAMISAKVALRQDGLKIAHSLETMIDAAGEQFNEIVWRLDSPAPG